MSTLVHCPLNNKTSIRASGKRKARRRVLHSSPEPRNSLITACKHWISLDQLAFCSCKPEKGNTRIKWLSAWPPDNSVLDGPWQPLGQHGAAGGTSWFPGHNKLVVAVEGLLQSLDGQAMDIHRDHLLQDVEKCTTKKTKMERMA